MFALLLDWSCSVRRRRAVGFLLAETSIASLVMCRSYAIRGSGAVFLLEYIGFAAFIRVSTWFLFHCHHRVIVAASIQGLVVFFEVIIFGKWLSLKKQAPLLPACRQHGDPAFNGGGHNPCFRTSASRFFLAIIIPIRDLLRSNATISLP